MNIVVVDGQTMNPGDIKWEPLKDMGNVSIYPSTQPEELLERCKDAEVIITNKVVIDETSIHKLDSLKLILLSATGYNNVNIAAAKEKGIMVCNASGYGTASVAQHTFALILALTNRVYEYNADVKNNGWYKAGVWMYQINPSIELANKTLGIVGYGNIGSNVARIAQGFDMNIAISHRRQLNDLPDHIRQMELEQLLSVSDVVSLHCPLTEENSKMMNKLAFEQMKSSALLINTSRGGLVNETDLAQALASKQIAGAGLDVLDEEPPQMNHPLLKFPNCVITPHRAWGTKAARQRLFDIVVGNLQAYLDGKPRNVIESN